MIGAFSNLDHGLMISSVHYLGAFSRSPQLAHVYAVVAPGKAENGITRGRVNGRLAIWRTSKSASDQCDMFFLVFIDLEIIVNSINGSDKEMFVQMSIALTTFIPTLKPRDFA